MPLYIIFSRANCFNMPCVFFLTLELTYMPCIRSFVNPVPVQKSPHTFQHSQRGLKFNLSLYVMTISWYCLPMAALNLLRCAEFLF